MRRPLVAVSALLLATAGCTSEVTGAGERMPVGAVVTGAAAQPHAGGRHGWVALPTGRIDFTVGQGVDELPVHDDAYDRAPKDGAVLPVGWQWDFHSTTGASVTDQETQPAPSVSLVVGEREYPIDEALLRPDGEDGGPLEYFGTAWVAVDAEVGSHEIDGATLQVEFDGVTQEVDPGDLTDGGERGDATALYGGRGLSNGRYALDCGQPGIGRPVEWSSTTTCHAEVLSTPWYQPVGWAPPGESWTVVTVTTHVGSSARDGGGNLLLEGEGAPSYSLGGQPPTEVLDGAPGRQSSAVLVFPPDARGELEARRTAWAQDTAGERRRERLTWRVRLYD
ncbi:MAG: hypothetical protein ACI379_09970 [Nocardioides sp.]|uniref:hypothetical protein n=1 Tax=Nocardioides sp. TaxID=35761 RepID=UPI003EFBAF57